ncbi:hypothetical protein [Haloarchaeobius sp. DFWS5]|uniref:hypothetical protein n=1 Tax=Haloarchaeobius sp. DFWS5 TaxID=3446114 RepID=UPI003EC0B078
MGEDELRSGAVTEGKGSPANHNLIGSKGDLEQALERVIREAQTNGVSIQGGYDLIDEHTGHPELTIEISEIQKR